MARTTFLRWVGMRERRLARGGGEVNAICAGGRGVGGFVSSELFCGVGGGSGDSDAMEVVLVLVEGGSVASFGTDNSERSTFNVERSTSRGGESAAACSMSSFSLRCWSRRFCWS